VLSSSGEERDRMLAAELGSCAYFVKPAAINELVKVIETLDSSLIAQHCARSG
jgi:DNA-binding response OmpR family regulator